MSDLETILNSAWNKDNVSLKPAVDAVMNDKIAAAVADYTRDYASSIFGATTGQDDIALEAPQPELEQTPDPTEVEQNEDL